MLGNRRTSLYSPVPVLQAHKPLGGALASEPVMTGSQTKSSSSPLDESRDGVLGTTLSSARQLGSAPYPDVSTLQKVSNAYKEGTGGRVLAKVGMAGAAGFMLGPFTHSGPVLTSAFVTGANAVAVIGFYDVLREALTSLTITDTPFLSLVAGGLTGVHCFMHACAIV